MKALSFADKLGHIYTIGIAEMYYGFILVAEGHAEEGAKYLQRSIETFDKSHGMLYAPLAQSTLGMAYCLIGDIPAALEHAKRALELREASGFSFLLSYHHYVLGLTHMESGDFIEALFHAEESIKFAHEQNEQWIEALAAALWGRVGWQSRKIPLEEAEGSIRKGIEELSFLRMKINEAVAYSTLGELFNEAGQREKALENLKKAEEMCLKMALDNRSHYLTRIQNLLARISA